MYSLTRHTESCRESIESRMSHLFIIFDICKSTGWIVTLNATEFFVWLEKMVIFELSVSTMF